MYLGFQIPVQNPFIMDMLCTCTHLSKPFQNLKQKDTDRREIIKPDKRSHLWPANLTCMYSDGGTELSCRHRACEPYIINTELSSFLPSDPLEQVSSTAELHNDTQEVISCAHTNQSACSSAIHSHHCLRMGFKGNVVCHHLQMLPWTPQH